MNGLAQRLRQKARLAFLIAALTSLATAASALAASTLPKSGDPIGIADLGWVAGVGVLILVVGLIVRWRRAGR